MTGHTPHRPGAAGGPGARRFVVLVPVKPPSVGKSRLLGLGDDRREALARAFALDTAAAALDSERVTAVLVVTDDAGFSAELAALGCQAIPDGVSLDLNGTLRQAAAEAARRWPGATPVALCADLPALRTHELDLALEEIAGADPTQPWFVADADAVGTTVYAAAYDAFDPQFGVGSATVHRSRGARGVSVAVPTLRRDVDHPGDLDAAAALGLGPRTAALVGSA